MSRFKKGNKIGINTRFQKGHTINLGVKKKHNPNSGFQKGHTLHLTHKEESCKCFCCKAKRKEYKGNQNVLGKTWKVKDTSKMKEAQNRPEVKENNRKKMLGNKYVLGKHWKVKDTSKYSGKNSLGYKHSEEFKKARRDYRHTDEAKRKIGEASSGEKHPMYKDGRSFIKTLEYREKLVGKKPNKCEICKTLEKDLKKKLCFDHDHKTEKFRGWICHSCNLALGLIKDDILTLKTMIIYLQNE